MTLLRNTNERIRMTTGIESGRKTYIGNSELFSVIYTRYTSLSLADEMIIVYIVGQETHFWLKKQSHLSCVGFNE